MAERISAKNKGDILYIFDIENKQEQYAKCLEFITILQGKSKLLSMDTKFERIRELVREINVYGIRVPQCAKNYYEQPLKMVDGLHDPVVLQARKVESEKVRDTIFVRDPSLLQYHIRIHLDSNPAMHIQGFIYLQYLALLLDRLEEILALDHAGSEKIFSQRVSVFIVPSSGDYYPFLSSAGEVDLDTYQMVSQYLRLLSQKNTGVIYGVLKQKEQISVRALDFKRGIGFKDYFPLIPLDKNTYQNLFDEVIRPDAVDQLFALKGNQRFQNSAASNPYTAFPSFIVETAFQQLREVLSQYKATVRGEIYSLVQEKLRKTEKGIPRLAFCIFLFTLQFCNSGKVVEPTNAQSVIDQNFDFAMELSEGLRQIAQNTLQHSSSHRGVFSFYLDDQKGIRILRVLLSDYNDQQSFIENFLSNIRREAESFGDPEVQRCYSALARCQDDISLGYFFGEYGLEAPPKAWIDFRRADTSAHVGLLLFSLIMERCKGQVSFATSREFKVAQKNLFFHAYEQEAGCSAEKLPDIPQCMIPGTQLSIAIPVGPIENPRPTGIGQMNSLYPLRENYSTFASYIDYLPKSIEFSGAVTAQINPYMQKQGALVLDAAHKHEIIACWERCWISGIDLSEQNYVYYLDLNTLPDFYLNSNDRIEMFIKGFANALHVICRDNKPRLFAMTNASKAFLNNIRQITISMAPRRFPSNLQLYIAGANLEENILLLGDTFCQAVDNAYLLSLEYGTQAYSLSEINRAHVLYDKAIAYAEGGTATSREVCPFDVILPEPQSKILSLFDARILKMADRPMDKLLSGYKLENTHMRLGNKMHIRSFYEMAFLFYRTSVANRIAFEILRDIKQKRATGNGEIDLQNSDILFYGYASYSKAILTSIQEMLKAYRELLLKRQLDATKDIDIDTKERLMQKLAEVPSHVALASYQHNLQSEFQSEDTGLYFDFYDDTLGTPLASGKVSLNQPIQVVQIVPISSTLTTFDKMEMRLEAAIEDTHSRGNAKTSLRYTVFWVTDSQAKSEEYPREETEKKYWSHVEMCSRSVELNPQTFRNLTPITYFMRSPVVWEDPLLCKLCYPDDVIAEVPLVETDQTSTVPAQQLRGQTRSANGTFVSNGKNEKRLLQLESCVHYGHIRREKNHFQFYIETQRYFNRVSKELREWLRELSKADNEDITQTPTQSRITPNALLNIIFSPEHATNVGFAQYVNNYYFNGNAEIVCINEDKEFRSNFKCEHTALSQSIEELLIQFEQKGRECTAEELPIRFYFVDDTIISGETFYKANSFLRTLIPAQYQHWFPANLIRKCFLLIDRLSRESKQAYVSDVDRDFYSFLHIDLSNMRTQGDSCACCKLKLNAEKLLKRSSTRNIANYWAVKADQYTAKGYNNYVLDGGTREKAFRKLVLSHITQNVLFKDSPYFEVGEIYDSILTILTVIIEGNPRPGIEFKYVELVNGITQGNGLKVVSDFLKIISRPFFSYDFKLKNQVLTFQLMLAEYLIDGKLAVGVTLQENEYKAFLFEKDRIAETSRLFCKLEEKYLKTKEDKIEFIQHCLLNNFVEMRSTYMMRKHTIMKLRRFLLVEDGCGGMVEHKSAKGFWLDFAAGVHQILDCNSDETKSLWLEYLLITGKEYREFYDGSESECFIPCTLFEALTVGESPEHNQTFRHFCDELLLQNSRVLFEGIENSLKSHSSGNAYFMDYWKRCRALDRFQRKETDENPSEDEKRLFSDLADGLKGSDGQKGSKYKVKERYDVLLSEIVAVAEKRYGFNRTDIALITTLNSEEYQGPPTGAEINQLDIVSCHLSSTPDSYFNKYEIKQKLVEELPSAEKGSVLKEYGYVVHKGESLSSPYFFIYFDDPENTIVPVYLYFSFADSGQGKSDSEKMLELMLFLRDLMSYRNRLLKVLQNDFAGDTFSKYAHTAGEKSILAHEKATSHNTTGDDSVILELFMNRDSAIRYDMLDDYQVLKWLLLRNYTNAQIAKLFNRNYRIHEEYDREANYPTPPPLYLKDVDREKRKLLSDFGLPLQRFSDLRWLSDGRFSLLESAVAIKCDKLKNVEFLKNPDEDTYYNVEYFKNILIDIIISAMKYGSTSDTYLERVDKYLVGVDKLRHPELLSAEKKELLKEGMCDIEFEIEEAPEEVFKYLVIRNRVNKLAHNLFDWKKYNLIIEARLRNPIDYADGHMSMLAISQYIEGLWPTELRRKTVFAYAERGGRLVFETKLPIIRKEG